MTSSRELTGGLKAFSEYLYRPRITDEITSEILKGFESGGKVNPEQGLKVYRRAQVFSLMDVLADIYPVLKMVLTDDVFNFCARNYIYENPSRQYDLNKYGKSFGKFVQQVKELEAHPYLGDLGSFEYCLHQSYYAASDEPLTPESFESRVKQDPEKIYLNFRKSVQVIQAKYPVHNIWEVYQRDSEDEKVQAEKDEFQYIILQDNYTPGYSLIENEFIEIVGEINQKSSLHDLALLPSVQKSPGLLNRALGHMLEQNLLAAFN